jgi:cell wall-associated NlpC family hydrolase
MNAPIQAKAAVALAVLGIAIAGCSQAMAATHNAKAHASVRALLPAPDRSAPASALAGAARTGAARAAAARTVAAHRLTKAAHHTTPAVTTAPLNPIAVTLDRALTQPQPGDSADTRAARAQLAGVQREYDAANQDYDHAAQTLSDVNVRLGLAQAAATRADKAAGDAQARLIAHVQSQYMDASPMPVEAQALLTKDGTGVLDRIDLANQISHVQASLLQTAQQLRQAAIVARQAVAQAQTDAATARNAAATAQNRAAAALSTATATVSTLHINDLLATAKAAAAAGDGLVPAAAALRARAVASGAATEASIPAVGPPAATIALAARALLNQAAGRGHRPTATGPAFHPTHGAPVDEQAVMGPTPNLGGTAAYAGTTGTLTRIQALTAFDGHVSNANWPNGGVGTKVPGTAPFRKPNGVTVNPTLPAYPKHYRPLRAEVAVDQALAQLGTPYVWDAAGPRTFDCSGLTLWAWGHAGVTLKHYTGDQVHEGTRVAPNQLLPGDLILFGGKLHHVGMYLGAGYMIDAPDTGEYVKIQKVSDDGDFAVAVRP